MLLVEFQALVIALLCYVALEIVLVLLVRHSLSERKHSWYRFVA